MVKSRGFKIKPIGGAVTVRSLKAARKITAKYHKIQNELTENNLTSTRRSDLENEMHELGGTDKYQKASKLATERFKTSRFVIRTLQDDLNLKPIKETKSKYMKLTCLEVGAINTQLQLCPWLAVTAIDLNSQHPQIQEEDFFNHQSRWYYYDVIVCSMVVNCVPCSYKRFEMLVRLHMLLSKNDTNDNDTNNCSGGVLFLMLPKLCISEVGEKHFNSLLQAIGFIDCVKKDDTPKISFRVLKCNTDTTTCESDNVDEKCNKAILRLPSNTSEYLKNNHDTSSRFSISITPPPP